MKNAYNELFFIPVLYSFAERATGGRRGTEDLGVLPGRRARGQHLERGESPAHHPADALAPAVVAREGVRARAVHARPQGHRADRSRIHPVPLRGVHRGAGAQGRGGHAALRAIDRRHRPHRSGRIPGDDAHRAGHGRGAAHLPRRRFRHPQRHHRRAEGRAGARVLRRDAGVRDAPR